MRLFRMAAVFALLVSPAHAQAPRFSLGPGDAPTKTQDELDAAIARATAGRDAFELTGQLQEAGGAAGVFAREVDRRQEAQQAVAHIQERLGESATLDALIRDSLRELAQRTIG